jgi:hypothetical protein
MKRVEKKKEVMIRSKLPILDIAMMKADCSAPRRLQI